MRNIVRGLGVIGMFAVAVAAAFGVLYAIGLAVSVLVPVSPNVVVVTLIGTAAVVAVAYLLGKIAER